MKIFQSLRGKDEPKELTSENGVDAKEARAVLREGCNEGRKIVLMTNHIGRVAQGRLRMVEGDALFIELLDPIFRGEFKPLSLCCAMMNRGSRAWSFLTNIRSHTVAGGRPMVSLQMPEHMTSSHGRTCFRTPLGEESPLQVIATIDGVPHEVEPVDISLGGMRFLLPAQMDMPKDEDEITLRMTFTGEEPEDDEDEDHGEPSPPRSNGKANEEFSMPATAWSEAINVPSMVRHTEDTTIGVYFRSAVRNGQLDPPRPLRRLVKALETHWLRTRVR